MTLISVKLNNDCTEVEIYRSLNHHELMHIHLPLLNFNANDHVIIVYYYRDLSYKHLDCRLEILTGDGGGTNATIGKIFGAQGRCDLC